MGASADRGSSSGDHHYPHHAGHFARIIDNYAKYPQSLIDDFSQKDKAPEGLGALDQGSSASPAATSRHPGGRPASRLGRRTGEPSTRSSPFRRS